MYPYIPAIPRYGYTVCRGVPKSTTVPVPALPVSENPRVFPYLCQSLFPDDQGNKEHKPVTIFCL